MRRALPYLLALGLAGPAPAPAQDDDGGGFLERKLEELLSGEGRDVAITGFAGALSSDASLDTMTFSDADGTWLRLADVELSWTRSALLLGRLEVNALRAGEIEFVRPPLPANELPSAEAPGFSLPELPVSVNIGEIAADRVILGAALFGAAAELSVAGTLALADGEGSGRIAAERLDGAEGSFVVEGNYANASGVLTVNAAVQEAPGGIVATLAGLPGAPALDLTIAGTGPLTDFGADLTLATDGVERVTGTLEVLATGSGDTEFRSALSGDVAPLLFPDYRAFFGPDLELAVSGTRRADGSVGIGELALDAAQIRLAGSAEIGADGLPDLIDLTGRIASADGTPVLLPQGGPPVRIDGADLRIGFDAARSEDWSAVIDIEGLERPGLRADIVRLDGQGRIEAGEVPHVTAALDFAASALDLGDPEAEAALGEDVSGRLALDWRQGAPVEISELSVAGETYALDGQATLTASDAGLDVTAEARVAARDLSVFSGLAERDLAGSLEADIAVSAAPVAGFYDITLDGRGTGLGTGIAEADALLEGEAVIEARVRRDATGSFVDRLAASTDAARIDASASLTSERGSAEARVTLLGTEVIAPGVPGPLTLRLTAEGAPELWDLRVTADGPDTGLDALLVLDLRGEVPAVSGNLAASLGDLAPYAPRIGRPVSGAVVLTAEGTLATDLSRFDLGAEADTTDLAIGETGIDALLRGTAQLSLSANRTGDTIAIPSLAFRSPAARLDLTTGALDLSGPAPALSGTLAASFGDLAPLGALAGRTLSGAAEVKAEGSLVADLSRFDLRADLAATDLALGQPQADQVLKGRATATLAASREGDTLRLPAFRFVSPQLAATASGEAQTGAALTDLRAGEGTATLRLLSAEGILPGLPVPLTARVTAEGTPQAVDLALSVEDEALSVTADTRLDLAGAVPKVSGTARIDADDIAPFSVLANRTLAGALSLDARGSASLDLSAFDITADARTRNLAIGQPDADALLAGAGTASLRATRANGVIEVERLAAETAALRLDATGTTGRDRNDASFDLRLVNVGRWVPGLPGAATATGTATQEGGGDWRVALTANGPGGTRASVAGSAAPAFDRVDLGATGSLPLQVANAFIAPRAVTGTARFDLRLAGPPALESLSGRVETAEARLTDPTLGVTLAGLRATVDLAGASARIEAGARIREGGRIAVAGPVRLAAPFPAELGITLASAVLADPSLYRTVVNGTVRIDGPLAGGAAIRGALALEETEVRIPSGAASAVGPTFEIAHLNEPAEVRQTRERAGLVTAPGEAPSGGGPAYPLDLTVSAPNRIFLRGRGLEAELGGTLRLGGTTAAVIPTGQFELVRGRLDILGQRLGLDEGIATLQGDFNPFVRLVAEARKDDTLVRIIVQGLAASPEILFQSEPPLPEDEVLARLLFGRSIETLSPLQAAQLASAVATLAGRGGDGLVGRLRQDFGLDDLDVTGDAEGGVGVRAGKYISDNLYSDVAVDSTGQAEVSINLDLSESVTVRGKVGSAGNTGLGVFYERDY